VAKQIGTFLYLKVVNLCKNSSLNVFDNGGGKLQSVIWTLYIVLMFFNYNVLCWVQSILLASIGGPPIEAS
jgi:hypothetical protein